MNSYVRRSRKFWTLGFLFSFFPNTQLFAQSITSKPWELSPSISNSIEIQQNPVWINPVPKDFEDFNEIKKHDFYDFLKRRPVAAVDVTRIAPSKFPKLPWFDLNKIPKSPIVEEPKVEKIPMPSITESLEVDGRVAIFKTTDEHLYYVVPNRWMVSLNGYVLDSKIEEKKGESNRLRFLLSPSYSWADDLISKIKAVDELALFVPIPKKIVNFYFEVPEIIGQVKAQILPTDGMPIGDQIYMSIELDEEAMDVFEILRNEKIFLTGSVRFTYPYDQKTNFDLVSDIWLNL